MCISVIFIAYSDIPWRRKVLATQSTLPDDYIFYGMPDLQAKGYQVHHNLERTPPRRMESKLNEIINQVWQRMGGYGGDWTAVVPHLRAINRSELVFSTVDRVGIPLVLLRHIGSVSPPILYTSIGLPERLDQLKNGLMRRLYYQAFRKVERIICYGFEEAERLRAWLNVGDDQVQFIPFGVKTDAFHPMSDSPITTDVVSIGADPHRDFSLLVAFAQGHPEVSIRIVTTTGHARKLGVLPDNVQLLTDVPFASIRDHIATARLVALPLKENSYSGATTTLLQTMAMAKPVVVSAVGAIKQGYSLQDGVNCKLIAPGNLQDLEQGILALLADSEWAQTMGTAARQTVIEYLSWEQYVKRLLGVFTEVAGLAVNDQMRKL